jgi:hypothetical protein
MELSNPGSRFRLVELSVSIENPRQAGQAGHPNLVQQQVVGALVSNKAPRTRLPANSQLQRNAERTVPV